MHGKGGFTSRHAEEPEGEPGLPLTMQGYWTCRSEAGATAGQIRGSGLP